MSKLPQKLKFLKKFAGAGAFAVEKAAANSKKFMRARWRRRKKINKSATVKALAVFLFCSALVFEYFHAEKIAREEEAIRPLKEKIGQMLMIGFRGTEIGDGSDIGNAIEELNLGGVILFDYDAPSKSRPRNIVDRQQTKKLIADLKSRAKNEPLLVAVDAEGGLINRLKPSMGFAEIDSAQSLAKKGGLAAINDYWTLARQLADLGFSINFAPVVDLNLNPENPVIGGLERSYSANPEIVAGYARTLIAAHRAFGILTALKHFPGHGSSSSDSHLALPDITETYEEQELAPYAELIKNGGADSIMTAHVINRNIDPEYPATLSEKFINGILRQDLEFDGVVFSDDMQMGAIIDHYGFEDAIVRAINAGCDILIFSNNGEEYDDSVARRAADTVLNAVKEGLISESRINESYARIMQLKSKLK